MHIDQLKELNETYFCMIEMCSMNNRNPKSDIQVQPENQKSKVIKPVEKSCLYQGWATPD